MWHEISGNFCHVFPILVAAIVVRVAYVLYWTGRPLRASASERVRTLIVLGSGGHTAEMLSILNALQKDRFVPRYYVAAVTDNMSLQKARVLEESLVQQGEVQFAWQLLQHFSPRKPVYKYFSIR